MTTASENNRPGTLVLFLVALMQVTGAGRVGAEHAVDHPATSPVEPSGLEVLQGLSGRSGPTDSDQIFLQPDAAFVLSTEVLDPHTVVVRWQLADTYYLYRKAFRFTTTTPTTIFLGTPIFPPAKFKEDPYFGRVEVYYDEVTAVLPIERRGAQATQLKLEIRYQGCTDRGLCYPPISKTFSIELPAS